MIGKLRQLSEPRLRQQAGIEKSHPCRKGYSCPMGEKRIVGPGKTRGYPYPVCKKEFSSTTKNRKKLCLIGGGGRVVRWCWLNFQCRGVLQFGYSRARAYCARSRCGWGSFGHFYSHLSFLSSFSLSLGDGSI